MTKPTTQRKQVPGSYYFRTRTVLVVNEFETSARINPVSPPTIFHTYSEFEKKYGKVFDNSRMMYRYINNHCTLPARAENRENRLRFHAQRTRILCPVFIQRTKKKMKKKKKNEEELVMEAEHKFDEKEDGEHTA